KLRLETLQAEEAARKAKQIQAYLADKAARQKLEEEREREIEHIEEQEWKTIARRTVVEPCECGETYWRLRRVKRPFGRPVYTLTCVKCYRQKPSPRESQQAQCGHVDWIVDRFGKPASECLTCNALALNDWL